MKLNELWLRELIDLNINSAELINQLTMLGLKVNNVKKVSKYLDNIVVGYIVSCQLHPNNKKLWITKVDVGIKYLLNIVCRADNCRKDLLVAVDVLNKQIPENSENKVIKLYGELSEGILCSNYELGISNEQNNVFELPKHAKIGRYIRDYLKIYDNIIDISITSNRSDCLSVLGIVRDIAAFNRLSFRKPIVKPIINAINDQLSIKIDNPIVCPFYLTRTIKNINIYAITPSWMKEKLYRCGFCLVNTLVNITNYVLLELGQPIFIFDRDLINGNITVRMGEQQDILTLPNGKKTTLLPDTLIITDHIKILAMAGIFVCDTSNVNSSTSNIVLNCAFFCSSFIRDQARRYNISTEMSYRYERGVDPLLLSYAIDRTTSLILDICGGKSGPITNINNKLSFTHPLVIMLRRKTIDRLIGHIISNDNIIDILTHLGFKVDYNKDDYWQVLVPSWRFDVKIEEDLIEEIIRIYNYNKIPSIPIRANLIIPYHSEAKLSLIRVKNLLVDRGYQEVITYSFVDPKKQILFYPNIQPLLLSNPVSNKMSVMRLSLWIGLLNTVIYNQNQQQQYMRLFESGLCFIPDKNTYLGVRQEFVLAGVISGLRYGEHWDLESKPIDFYDAKGDIEAILELTGQLNDIEFKTKDNSALDLTQNASIYLRGKLIGSIGFICSEIELKLQLKSRTLVFELLWEKIATCNIPKINKISRFQMNRRDIAVIVANKFAAADIIAECKKTIKNKLININLFDLYQGKGVPKGFKSLAISLILQDETCTLKEAEINENVEKCLSVLNKKYQAYLRN